MKKLLGDVNLEEARSYA